MGAQTPLLSHFPVTLKLQARYLAGPRLRREWASSPESSPVLPLPPDLVDSSEELALPSRAQLALVWRWTGEAWPEYLARGLESQEERFGEHWVKPLRLLRPV